MQRKTRIAIAATFSMLWLAAPTRAENEPTAVEAESVAEADAAEAPTAEALTAEERAIYERLVALDAALEYQSGSIPIGDGLATLSLPDTLRYMNPENTERLLVEGWGNPSGGGTLGMIVPSGSSPLSGDSWGVVLSYDEEGYVSDEDADGIDYDTMLEEMQAATNEENAARAEQGFEQVELVGWAERPRYDAETHKLFWAKELAFEGSPSNTLNYNVRVLGRRGVLVLNAVASMDQLELIQSVMPGVIAAAEFDEGHRYADYQPGTDKLATYGIAALVAGGVAAKSGLLTKLIALALAGKKLLIPALVALFAGGGTWLKGRGGRTTMEDAEAGARSVPTPPEPPTSPTSPT
ncbi:MAG: DUF2167 domain-containing protein [Deltaproteobacteria bacterium]|nr:DUF2167 domain-containing protein [Deltaproteobacteria bacterium]